MFKSIPKYNGEYFINESGYVMKKNADMFERISVNNDGYMYVRINGKSEFIHQLVAEAFLENPNNYKNIIHKDKDPLNNHVSNLLYSNKENDIILTNRDNRSYSGAKNVYEVYNEDTGDSIFCIGRNKLAETIEYEEISLKNMVGNGRKIYLGPYKGYQIRRRTDFRREEYIL